MRTPGIIGLSGKCPGKKLSLIVTFFIPTADTPGLYSITLSTNRNGNLCGKISRIWLMSMIVGNAGNTGIKKRKAKFKSRNTKAAREVWKKHTLFNWVGGVWSIDRAETEWWVGWGSGVKERQRWRSRVKWERVSLSWEVERVKRGRRERCWGHLRVVELQVWFMGVEWRREKFGLNTIHWSTVMNI